MNYSEMSVEDVKGKARKIVRSSSSDEEIRTKFVEDLGYPDDPAGICIYSQRNGSSLMAMVMFHGPNGEVVSIC